MGDSAQWDPALIWSRAVSEISKLIYDPQWPVIALALAKRAKLELYHGNFAMAVEAGEQALRLLTVAYEEGTEMLIELRQIVAESRAEAGAELQRRPPGDVTPALGCP